MTHWSPFSRFSHVERTSYLMHSYLPDPCEKNLLYTFIIRLCTATLFVSPSARAKKHAGLVRIMCELHNVLDLFFFFLNKQYKTGALQTFFFSQGAICAMNLSKKKVKICCCGSELALLRFKKKKEKEFPGADSPDMSRFMQGLSLFLQRGFFFIVF